MATSPTTASTSTFVPRRTAAYVDQTDIHLGELTARETFDFSSRCQGVGHKAGEQ